MNLRFFIASCAAVCVLILTGPEGARAASTDTQRAAAECIEQHMGRNLISLGHAVAIRTHTYIMMSARLERPSAERLLDAKLARYRPVYQARWDASLSCCSSRADA